MTALRKSVVDVAEYNIPVLILGPSGSGKELVAQSLAELSGRSGKLVSVNCASIPHSLLEAELFGYEKGAFTGASKSHKGKFEQAHNGTLFLDEIGDMPQDLQSKLLRALETKTFTPVGSSREVAVDFRLVCATHKNLYKQVVTKTFRSDLFFRISAFPIRIPALRDRSDDIEKLIFHLAQQLSVVLGDSAKFSIEKDAIWVLKTFSWPGNVRQLRNVVECLMIRANGAPITAQQVQKALREQSRQRLHKDIQSAVSSSKTPSPVESVTDYRAFFVSNGKLIIADHLKSVEKEVIAAAITAAQDDYDLAAQMLHLSLPELFEKKEVHGL
jgi:DNA-binding NtrC family response regulator